MSERRAQNRIFVSSPNYFKTISHMFSSPSRVAGRQTGLIVRLEVTGLTPPRPAFSWQSASEPDNYLLSANRSRQPLKMKRRDIRAKP